MTAHPGESPDEEAVPNEENKKLVWEVIDAVHEGDEWIQ
jgi:hypothetical protein